MAKPKLDPILADAIDLARDAALEVAGVFGVGVHLGVTCDGDRLATHWFACSHRAYLDWRWSVSLTRAARAKVATVNEVVLLPTEEALQAPRWIPWADRVQPGDVAPGLVMPTADDDPRLEPGFTGGETAADADPVEASLTRMIVAELGLGRERVLSEYGRSEAAERWLAGDPGPDNPISQQAPGPCATCGYFVRLQGRLGALFGACTNQYSPSDAKVVAVDHGCGGHSDVVAEERSAELPQPVWDTISIDNHLFD